MEIMMVKLIVQDVMNASDDDARRLVTEILNEAFGKEEMKENPRVKLLLMQVEHKK